MARRPKDRVTTLVLEVGANLFLRAAYARLEGDLEENAAAPRRFSHAVLEAIFRNAEAAALEFMLAHRMYRSDHSSWPSGG